MNSPSTPPGGFLDETLGVEWIELVANFAKARLVVARKHMAPNGYLHAASIIALADSACGVGCSRSLPEGASSFTALELKSNFLGTAAEGQAITCHTRLVHGGRTTQVQDAEIANETTGKPVAHFRCTQLILYPRA